MTVKPTFSPGLNILRVGALALVIVVTIVVMCTREEVLGVMAGLGYISGSDDIIGFLKIVGPFALLIGIVLAAIIYVNNQLAVKVQTITFYPNEMEFLEGIFSKRRKLLSYDNIREVMVEEGIIQQQFGLGALSFITAAQEGGDSAAGIRLDDVADVEAVYQKIYETVPLGD